MSETLACWACGKPLPKPRLYAVTCSKECHERLIEALEAEFGRYKRVVDDVTGKTHRVPTRDIIEKGLKYGDLSKYPMGGDM